MSISADQGRIDHTNTLELMGRECRRRLLLAVVSSIDTEDTSYISTSADLLLLWPWRAGE